MRNFRSRMLCGILAVSAVLPVMLVACNNPTGPDPDPTPGGTVVAWFNSYLGANTVDLYFPESDSLVLQAYITGETPNDILSPGEGRLAILGSGSADIRVFDLDLTGTELFSIQLPMGSNPYLMALDGSDVWVTLLLTSRVARTGIQSSGAITQFDVPANPTSIACAAGKVFVGHGTWPDTTVTGGITVLDAITGQIQGAIATPDNVTSLTYFQETGMVHAVTTTYVGDGMVSIIDPSSEQVMAQVPTGGSPGAPVRTGSSFVCGNGFFSSDIFVYDESGTLISTWDTGVSPGGLAVIGDTLYIADYYANSVYLADWGTRTFIDTLQTGDGPQAMAVVQR